MRASAASVALLGAPALAGCASAPVPPEGFVAGEGVATLPDAAAQVDAGSAFAYATWFADGTRYTDAAAPDERADWVIRSACVSEARVDDVFVPPEQVGDFRAAGPDLCRDVPTSE
jgi:hypothetical protein